MCVQSKRGPKMRSILTLTSFQVAFRHMNKRHNRLLHFFNIGIKHCVVYSAQNDNKLDEAARPHLAQTLTIKQRSVGGWNIWPERAHNYGNTY